VDEPSGLTETIAASAATLVCSTVCCAVGIYAVAEQGSQGALSSGMGVPMVLLGLMVWIVPPLVWSMSGGTEGEDWGAD